MFVLVGLGNPGSEYENTRHNTGRIVLDAFAQAQDFPAWSADKKLQALVSKGAVSPVPKTRGKRSAVLLVEPETFMNKSGQSLREIKDLRFKIYDKKKAIPNLVVIHDDLDIPFGSYKISFNKSSGGHRGVESIIRAIKTQAFVRVRVGIASSAAAVKKSQDDAAVGKTILGKFSGDQLDELRRLAKEISEGLVVLITEGREKAMSQYHA